MTRLLTEGEMSVAKKVFKGSINYPQVKIHNKKYMFFQAKNSAMSPNGDIYVHGIFSQDYANESSALRGFFIHELVHVWQYQNKVLNVKLAAIWEILSNALKYNDSYRYTLVTPHQDNLFQGHLSYGERHPNMEDRKSVKRLVPGEYRVSATIEVFDTERNPSKSLLLYRKFIVGKDGIGEFIIEYID